MNKQLSKLFYIFLLLSLPFVAGCSALLSKQPLQMTYYSLESSQAQSLEQLSPSSNLKSPTLIINMPKANAGFDTRRMMYTRLSHQLEYFAKNEWIDTPARMLQPLLVSAIEKTASFNAVLPKYGSVKSDIRLESEIVQLIQIFNTKPSLRESSLRESSLRESSKVQFTLRATIIDNATNKVILHHEFNEVVDAESDDPVGGVIAANLAVNKALEKLSIFCQQAAIAWQTPKSNF